MRKQCLTILLAGVFFSGVSLASPAPAYAPAVSNAPAVSAAPALKSQHKKAPSFCGPCAKHSSSQQKIV